MSRVMALRIAARKFDLDLTSSVIHLGDAATFSVVSLHRSWRNRDGSWTYSLRARRHGRNIVITRGRDPRVLFDFGDAQHWQVDDPHGYSEGLDLTSEEVAELDDFFRS